MAGQNQRTADSRKKSICPRRGINVDCDAKRNRAIARTVTERHPRQHRHAQAPSLSTMTSSADGIRLALAAHEIADHCRDDVIQHPRLTKVGQRSVDSVRRLGDFFDHQHQADRSGKHPLERRSTQPRQHFQIAAQSRPVVSR